MSMTLSFFKFNFKPTKKCIFSKANTSKFICSIANLTSTGKLVDKNISLSYGFGRYSSKAKGPGEYEKVFMEHWRSFPERPSFFTPFEEEYEKGLVKFWRKSQRPYTFSPMNGKLHNVPETKLKHLPQTKLMSKTIKDQWQHREQMLKSRTGIKYENQKIKNKINNKHDKDRNESFESKGIKPDLIKILNTFGITQPLPIQKLSFRHVFGHRNLIIQSETGSGKTLAYLLPILQNLGSEESCGTIIAVPTRELAHQVMSEAYKFIEDKNIIGCYRKPQLIACSATISREMIDNLMSLGFGEHVKFIKPNTYTEKTRVIPNCINHQYIIVDESTEDSKLAAFLRYLKNAGNKSVLLFISRKLSVQKFVDQLKDVGLRAVAFYKEIESGETEVMDKFFQDFKSGKIQVAVESEATVRGLDFKELSDVCLMEVPENIDEYLHLAGRVGRVGLPGTVTTLISDKSADSFVRLNLFCSELNVECQQKIV